MIGSVILAAIIGAFFGALIATVLLTDRREKK